MDTLERFALAFFATCAGGATIGGVMAFWIWFWEEAAFIGGMTTICAIAFGLLAAFATE